MELVLAPGDQLHLDTAFDKTDGHCMAVLADEPGAGSGDQQHLARPVTPMLSHHNPEALRKSAL